jgi:hypothetical protein
MNPAELASVMFIQRTRTLRESTAGRGSGGTSGTLDAPD